MSQTLGVALWETNITTEIACAAYVTYKGIWQMYVITLFTDQ